MSLNIRLDILNNVSGDFYEFICPLYLVSHPELDKMSFTLMTYLGPYLVLVRQCAVQLFTNWDLKPWKNKEKILKWKKKKKILERDCCVITQFFQMVK